MSKRLLDYAFQASNALAEIRNRGRAYRCKRCSKVLRKGRMMGHVLKHHVPLDRVPYSCGLCCFRCDDRDTLLNHIQKYRRHVEAEAKLLGPPNYAEILKRAENPYIVGDQDMDILGREESVQFWNSRRHLPNMEGDTFVDEEDEEEDGVVMVNGKAYPSWELVSTATAVQTYPPTPIIQTVHGTNQPHLTNVNPAMTSQPGYYVPQTVRGSLPAVQPLAFHQPVVSRPQIAMPALLSVNRSKTGPITSTPTSTILTATNSRLNTPVMTVRSPANSSKLRTPCQDENILAAILDKDLTDPFVQGDLSRRR